MNVGSLFSGIGGIEIGFERAGFETAWVEYRRTNATNNWESGISRVASKVPNRVDRIKCLGNAVVPQVAQAHAQAIKEVFFR